MNTKELKMKDYAKIDTSKKQSIFYPILEGIVFSLIVIVGSMMFFVLASY